jgi:hypothetical protein
MGLFTNNTNPPRPHVIIICHRANHRGQDHSVGKFAIFFKFLRGATMNERRDLKGILKVILIALIEYSFSRL